MERRRVECVHIRQITWTAETLVFGPFFSLKGLIVLDVYKHGKEPRVLDELCTYPDTASKILFFFFFFRWGGKGGGGGELCRLRF